MPERNRITRAALAAAAHGLYSAAVDQAREPRFYAHCGVPDSLDGRFDMIALHVVLVIRRLRRVEGAEALPASRLAQAVFDLMFADMDQNLREMGAGDLGVGRRVKAMATGFYGRAAAYEEALEDSREKPLAEAVRRNLYGTLGDDALPAPEIRAALAAYIRRAAAALDGQTFEAMLDGALNFGPPPEA